MDSLPAELLTEVVKYIHPDACRQELKNLRFSSRALSDIAAKRLFGTLPLWISQKSLQNLTDVADHPQISQYVNTIAFSPLQFHVWGDLSMREGYISEYFKQRQITCETFTSILEKSTKAYTHYTETQIALKNDDTDRNIMAAAFQRLPHLQRLEVNTHPLHNGIAKVYREFGLLSGEELDMSGHHTLLVLISALNKSQKFLSHFKIGHIDNLDEFDTRLLHGPIVDRELQLQPRFDSLNLHVRAMETALSHKCQQRLEILSSPLQTLEIIRPPQVVIDRRWQIEEPSQLAQLLPRLPSVESLMIRSTGINRSGAHLPIYSNLLAEASMPKLQHLDLQMVYAADQSMHSFFSRHAAGLVDVELHAVKINVRTEWEMDIHIEWVNLLDDLRKLDFAMLNSFTMSYCCDYEESLDVTAFLRGEVDRNPLLSYCGP